MFTIPSVTSAFFTAYPLKNSREKIVPFSLITSPLHNPEESPTYYTSNYSITKFLNYLNENLIPKDNGFVYMGESLKIEVNFNLGLDNISAEYEFKSGSWHDGASIPSSCWGLIGKPTDPEFALPSKFHDVGTLKEGYKESRYVHDSLFMFFLNCVQKIPRWKFHLMYYGVTLFSMARVTLKDKFPKRWLPK